MSCPIFVQIRSHPVAQLDCDITGTRGFQPVRVFETRDQEKSHCGINLCLIGLKLDQGVTSSILDRLAQTFFCSAQNLWLYNAIITASVKNPWTLVRSFSAVRECADGGLCLGGPNDLTPEVQEPSLGVPFSAPRGPGAPDLE